VVFLFTQDDSAWRVTLGKLKPPTQLTTFDSVTMGFMGDETMKRCFVVGVFVLAVASAILYFGGTSAIEAQSGTRSSRGLGGPPLTFEQKFWSYLNGTQPAYRNWAPYPGTSADAYPGQSPHGAFLKLYLNRVAAGNPKELPYGSIIVKENFGKDKTTLMAVTVMYRANGYDPEHHDWYWVKYNPDGTVATKGDKQLAGKVKGCIACHSGADGDDFSFAND
jgi:hypothetical protein